MLMSHRDSAPTLQTDNRQTDGMAIAYIANVNASSRPLKSILRLNWRLKVYSTADNAGITESEYETLGIVECRN